MKAWAAVLGLALAVPAHAALADDGAVAPKGTVEITTSDGQGSIFLDGQSVGEGSFQGDVAAGDHLVAVAREGFVRFEKKVSVQAGKTLVETVTLHRVSAAPVVVEERSLAGFYGGVQLFAQFLPAGAGGTLDTSCALLGASACDTAAPYGGGLAGYVGYSWDPVALELYFGGSLDYQNPNATFDGQVKPGSNALLTGVARVEDFRILRGGGFGAIRARVTTHGERLRASFAVGLGFAYRVVAMDRLATSTDGQNLVDYFTPDPLTYLSPALSLEADLHLRMGRTFALVAGLVVWLENAGTAIVTPSDPARYLYNAQNPGVPIRTPDYALTSGTQFFVGPMVGAQFGP